MVSRFVYTHFHDYEAIHFGCVYKALIVNCIRASIAFKDIHDDDYLASKYHFDGHMWMQDSYATWQARFPYLCLRTIKTYLKELCDSGYLIKYGGNSAQGRFANFYRINQDQDLHLKSLLATVSPSAKNVDRVEEPKGKICTTPSAEFALPQVQNLHSALLSTNNQTIYQTNKSPALRAISNIWDTGDELANIFSNLAKLPACQKKMDIDSYRTKLTKIMADLSLTLEEMAEGANEWQEHHNQQRKKPTDCMRSFRTWMANSIKWGLLSEKPKHGRATETYSKTNDEKPWER